MLGETYNLTVSEARLDSLSTRGTMLHASALVNESAVLTTHYSSFQDRTVIGLYNPVRYAALQDRAVVGLYNSFSQRIAAAQISHWSNPLQWISQRTIEAAQDAWTRKKEKALWYYRRIMGIFDRVSIEKAIQRQLQRSLRILNPKSFLLRLQAALVESNNYRNVKVHSPPLRLFPKTLHPIDSAA